MDIVKQLREQAAEIAREGHFGWGNTMLEAARVIEELQAAQQSVQSDGARVCPACKSLLEEHSVYCDNCGTDTPRR